VLAMASKKTRRARQGLPRKLCSPWPYIRHNGGKSQNLNYLISSQDKAPSKVVFFEKNVFVFKNDSHKCKTCGMDYDMVVNNLRNIRAISFFTSDCADDVNLQRAFAVVGAAS